MAESIYKIPVSEAFDASLEREKECPFCRLYHMLEENELEIILGGAMMEPDIRIRTNKQGFCNDHYGKMFTRKNRLGMALILESHLNQLREEMSSSATDLLKGKGGAAMKRAEELRDSCYICGRISGNFEKMIETAVILYEDDPEFPKKAEKQPLYCLPHFTRFLRCAKNSMNKKKYGEFYERVAKPFYAYFDSLRGDVSHFCNKFDYRFDDLPWGNSKDSVERSIRFLTSGLSEEEKNAKK
ncbi:MAG: hypothetical protein E7599_04850 [Ruminococcaceae bacterium]|nr:hypothetical protein [Oscillospiraceae bacterium]